jgi:hypothetical protein
MLSWALVIVFTVTYNLKVTSLPDLSWVVVFIPIFILVGFWFLFCVYILINYMLSSYALKVSESHPPLPSFFLTLIFVAINCLVTPRDFKRKHSVYIF